MKAIHASPDADAPRLMFADCLLERSQGRVKCPHQSCGVKARPGHVVVNSGRNYEWGKPRERMCSVCDGEGTVLDTSAADRAEFIKLQIEIANWSPYVTPPDLAEIASSDRLYSEMAKKVIEAGELEHKKRCAVLMRRAEDLLRKHVGVWCPPAPWLSAPTGWRSLSMFKRGFMLEVPVGLHWAFTSAVFCSPDPVYGADPPLVASHWAFQVLENFPEIISMPLIGKDPNVSSNGMTGVFWQKESTRRQWWGGNPEPYSLPDFIYDQIDWPEDKTVGMKYFLPKDDATAPPENVARACKLAIDALGTTVAKMIRQYPGGFSY